MELYKKIQGNENDYNGFLGQNNDQSLHQGAYTWHMFPRESQNLRVKFFQPIE